MKLSCEVIKDLLPLYHDSVCSNESKELVDEHLRACKDCSDELAAMNKRLPAMIETQNLSEAEAVKKLSKRWKIGMIKSVMEGILFTLFTVAAVFLILYLFFGIRIT